MSTNRPLKVFLCHSSADKPAVRELYQKLRAEPWIDPWLDEEELYPGQDWDLEIQKAIKETDAIIVCVSKSSITKEGYVQKEIKKALDYSDEKPDGTVFIIPVRLEECQPPERLSKWQYADYFEGQRDKAFQRLLGSLKRRVDSLSLKPLSIELNVNKKKEVILPKFYRREIHIEYKINADAKTVNDYLLQLYTGVAFFIEAFNSIYQVDTIEAFTPDGYGIFQWGFVASGTITTAQHEYTAVAGIRMTPDPFIEPVSEMFLVSISQGQKGVSILSFDTDIKHAHMFTTGLVRDLRTAFSVEILSPSQYLRFQGHEQIDEKQEKNAIQTQKTDTKNSLEAIKINLSEIEPDEEVGGTPLAAVSIFLGLLPIFGALLIFTSITSSYFYTLIYFIVGIFIGILGVYLRVKKINTWRFVLSAFGISMVVTLVLVFLLVFPI